MRGAAIECRIYAEDPASNFLPSPGLITRLKTPAGPGVRDDSGIYEGWEVPVYYDSLLAKLSVWAETRHLVIARLARALDEYTIEGIRTSLPFFRAIVQNDEFRRADFDTGFIDRNLAELMKQSDANQGDSMAADIAAIAAVLYARDNATRNVVSTTQEAESRWKLSGRLTQRRF